MSKHRHIPYTCLDSVVKEHSNTYLDSLKPGCPAYADDLMSPPMLFYCPNGADLEFLIYMQYYVG